jgi:hypothetical protein
MSELWTPGNRHERRYWKSASGGGGAAALPSYHDQIISYGATLWWKLNELAGPTAVDSSGNGNNGAYAGSGVTYGIAGPIPGETAVTLDGTAGAVTSSYVQVSTVAVSLIVWWQNLPTIWAPFLAGTDWPYSSGDGISLVLGTLGGTGTLLQSITDYTALIAGGAYGATHGSLMPNDANWHMLAATAYENPHLTAEVVYLDGLPVGANNTRPGGTALVPSTNTFQVGKPYGAGSYYPGNVAEVALFDGVALTPAQVANLWAAA